MFLFFYTGNMTTMGASSFTQFILSYFAGLFMTFIERKLINFLLFCFVTNILVFRDGHSSNNTKNFVSCTGLYVGPFISETMGLWPRWNMMLKRRFRGLFTVLLCVVLLCVGVLLWCCIVVYCCVV